MINTSLGSLLFQLRALLALFALLVVFSLLVGGSAEAELAEPVVESLPPPTPEEEYDRG